MPSFQALLPTGTASLLGFGRWGIIWCQEARRSCLHGHVRHGHRQHRGRGSIQNSPSLFPAHGFISFSIIASSKLQGEVFPGKDVLLWNSHSSRICLNGLGSVKCYRANWMSFCKSSLSRLSRRDGTAHKGQVSSFHDDSQRRATGRVVRRTVLRGVWHAARRFRLPLPAEHCTSRSRHCPVDDAGEHDQRRELGTTRRQWDWGRLREDSCRLTIRLIISLF